MKDSVRDTTKHTERELEALLVAGGEIRIDKIRRDATGKEMYRQLEVVVERDKITVGNSWSDTVIEADDGGGIAYIAELVRVLGVWLTTQTFHRTSDGQWHQPTVGNYWSDTPQLLATPTKITSAVMVIRADDVEHRLMAVCHACDKVIWYVQRGEARRVWEHARPMVVEHVTKPKCICPHARVEALGEGVEIKLTTNPNCPRCVSPAELMGQANYDGRE